MISEDSLLLNAKKHHAQLLYVYTIQSRTDPSWTRCQMLEKGV